MPGWPDLYRSGVYRYIQICCVQIYTDLVCTDLYRSGVYTVLFFAGKSPNIRSNTVNIYTVLANPTHMQCSWFAPRGSPFSLPHTDHRLSLFLSRDMDLSYTKEKLSSWLPLWIPHPNPTRSQKPGAALQAASTSHLLHDRKNNFAPLLHACAA